MRVTSLIVPVVLLVTPPLPALGQSVEPPEIPVDVRRVLQEPEGVRPLVRVGPNGLLHLGFWEEGVLRALDPGTLRERMVFRGEPGQLFPYRLGWREEDLWVLDARSIRFFAPDGRRKEERPLPAREFGPGVRAGLPAGVLPDGSLIRPGVAGPEDLAASGPGWSAVVAGTRAVPPATPVDRLPIFIDSPDGSHRQEVVTLQAANVMFAYVFTRSGQLPGFGSSQQPFADDDLFHVDPGGRVVVVVDRRVPGEGHPSFTVHRIRLPGGDTVSSQRYSHDPIPVTVQLAEAALREIPALRRPDEVDVDAVRAAIRVPPHLPPVTSVLSDATARTFPGSAYSTSTRNPRSCSRERSASKASDTWRSESWKKSRSLLNRIEFGAECRPPPPAR